MVAFPMAVTERTQNRVISIFSYLAGKAAPRRPADFTGVLYAPEYPLDGLGSVPFLQISWIRPSRDMPVSLTQNPPVLLRGVGACGVYKYKRAKKII